MRSFSLDEWCALHSLSRAYFYKMDSEGNAPRSFYVGRVRRISETANAEWLAEREAAPVNAEAASKATAAAMKGVAARKAKAAAAPVAA
jgi:predicted DNA-binding transcriptional regulator AlpA